MIIDTNDLLLMINEIKKLDNYSYNNINIILKNNNRKLIVLILLLLIFIILYLLIS